MKQMFKKTWFIGTLIIGITLLMFLFNLWIMSLNLKVPYDENNFWYLGKRLADGGYANYFAFAFIILFYVSIAPILLSGVSFFRKNNWGFIVSVLYFLGFNAVFVVFQAVTNYLTIFALILVILNIIFAVSIFVLLIIRNKMLDHTIEDRKHDQQSELSNSKVPFNVLLVNIASFIVFITTFFIPLFALTQSGTVYNAIIIRVLFSGDTNIEVITYFLVNFAIFLSIFLYFAKVISYYFYDKERFINQSKVLITFIFIATLSFFITGLVLDIYYSLQGATVDTIAFIPMLLMCIVIFIYSILKGQYSATQEISSGKISIKYAKVEPLLYVIALTMVSLLMLLLPIIKITITYGTYSHFVDLSGIDILRDYASLDPGYRIVAYILVVMLVSIGLTLVVSISSYLARYKQFSSIVKLATAVNIFFVFIIAISGYYFQIAKEINQVVILDIFSFYGISLPNALDMDYRISTDAIYALLASVSVLVLMFTRKAFDRDDLSLLDANLVTSNESNSASSSSLSDEEEYQLSDPCPSFSELDSKLESFTQDLEIRKAYRAKETSLNELIHFIVEYARNSRLHLSYTPEDIATFVSGLGASRLSILQGMSGTGKTSLPKIFSEAVFGNCEIIEVESSWKDKNELLGYYNEFSMKYTPKKFTLALYKAALN
ncbi:MAG: hypothetical protein CVV60_06580, partial [Tenericutes bacterium HGW-Tenericutes-5]